MLDQLDKLIREVLVKRLAFNGGRIRFDPPDENWRAWAANHSPSVNVYLVDVRENRALRDPEWQLEFQAARPQRRPGPLRVDCHYLISTWARGSVSDAVEPTLQEHALLYSVLGALAEANPLRPYKYYPKGTSEIDPLIYDNDLPVSILPGEGWPKLTEFWAGMGRNSRTKPVLWYTVTLPVFLPNKVAGPLVTTRIIEFKQGFDGAAAEQWLQIAGTVTDAEGKPADGAVVTVQGASGEVVGTASAGADGRFSVGGLQRDGYEIVGRKGALIAKKTPTLPGRTGDYDLKLPHNP